MGPKGTDGDVRPVGGASRWIASSTSATTAFLRLHDLVALSDDISLKLQTCTVALVVRFPGCSSSSLGQFSVIGLGKGQDASTALTASPRTDAVGHDATADRAWSAAVVVIFASFAATVFSLFLAWQTSRRLVVRPLQKIGETVQERR